MLTEGELFSIALFDNLLEQYRNTPIEAALRRIFVKIVKSMPERVTVDSRLLSPRISVISDHRSVSRDMPKGKLVLHRVLPRQEGTANVFFFEEIPVIGKIADDIATSIDLIKDFINGRYRRVPTRVIVSTFAGILYILSPIDLIPDFIPFFGWLDDAFVFTLILNGGLSLELDAYRK